MRISLATAALSVAGIAAAAVLSLQATSSASGADDAVRPTASTSVSGHHGEPEPGDDHGHHGGGHHRHHGGNHAEPGDDHGNHAEPGDDHGNHGGGHHGGGHGSDD